MSDKVGQASCR